METNEVPQAEEPSEQTLIQNPFLFAIILVLP